MTEQTSIKKPDISRANRLADIVVFLLISGGLLYLDHRLTPAGVYQGFLSIIGAFVVVVIITRARGESFSNLGLRRPKRWVMLPLWIVLIFVVTVAVATAVQLAAAQFITAPVDVSKFEILYQNFPMLVISLVSVWVTAAFMEEIVYRGFLLGRLLDISSGGAAAVVFMTLLHAVIFGALHLYQGPLGVLSTGVVAFVFGLFFAMQGRNLWALIVVHGAIDTLGLIQFYLNGVPQPQ